MKRVFEAEVGRFPRLNNIEDAVSRTAVAFDWSEPDGSATPSYFSWSVVISLQKAFQVALAYRKMGLRLSWLKSALDQFPSWNAVLGSIACQSLLPQTRRRFIEASLNSFLDQTSNFSKTEFQEFTFETTLRFPRKIFYLHYPTIAG